MLNVSVTGGPAVHRRAHYWGGSLGGCAPAIVGESSHTELRAIVTVMSVVPTTVLPFNLRPRSFPAFEARASLSRSTFGDELNRELKPKGNNSPASNQAESDCQL